MSEIKNTNQKVGKSYYDNFDNIFKSDEPRSFNGNDVYTGTYKMINGKMVKIDTTTPSHVRGLIEPLMKNGVRKLKPINVKKKNVKN